MVYTIVYMRPSLCVIIKIIAFLFAMLASFLLYFFVLKETGNYTLSIVSITISLVLFVWTFNMIAQHTSCKKLPWQTVIDALMAFIR